MSFLLPQRFSVLFLCAAFGLTGCSSETQPSTGSGYGPVTETELIAAEFSHRTGRKKYDFTWEFSEAQFVVEGPEIPRDLVLALLDTEDPIERITGTWEIREEAIHFTTDTDGSSHKTSLPVFFTGVIRIQTDNAQYVF